jgi:hypothetical protein
VVDGAPALASEMATSVFQDGGGGVYYVVEGPRELVESSSWEWDAFASTSGIDHPREIVGPNDGMSRSDGRGGQIGAEWDPDPVIVAVRAQRCIQISQGRVPFLI